MALAPITCVSFDVGGTLLAPYPSVGHTYALVARQHGIEADAALLNQRFRAAWKTAKSVSSPMSRAWWQALTNDVFSLWVPELPEPFFTALFDAFRDPRAWRIFPDVSPTLNELKTRNLRLVAASNWDDRLPALLRDLGLAHFFEKVFYSEQLNAAKPSPAFFAAVARELRSAPEQILHVGDDESEDVAGARAAGVRAILLDRSQTETREGIICDLRQIAELIGA